MNQHFYQNRTKKKIYKRPKPLGAEQTFDTMAVKCYEEQLKFGKDNLIQRIKGTDPEDFEIIAILHSGHDIKKHVHVAIKARNKKGTHVGTMLRMLGIEFRKDVDDELKKRRGLETCGDYASFVRYMLHRSPRARMEGKTPYQVSDCISNLSASFIQNMVDGIGKSTAIDVLRFEAESLGFELGDFEEWLKSADGMPVTKRDLLLKSYSYGVARRADMGATIDRVCIVIGINTLMGNYENIRNMVFRAACVALGESQIVCCSTNNKNTGAITPATKAIIYDVRGLETDKKAVEFLNSLTGSKLSRVRTQGGRGAFWAGKYVVVIADIRINEVTLNRLCNDINYGRVTITHRGKNVSSLILNGRNRLFYGSKLLTEEEESVILNLNP